MKQDTMQEIKVLIADDHTIFRQSLERLLETNSLFKVVAGAKDGLEAVKLTEELKPDVVLMDISMPGIDGLEAARQILATHPHIKVIILTMYESEDLVRQAVEVGVSGYIMKDTDMESLFQSIVSAHEGNILLGPLATRRLIEGYGRSQEEGLTKREKEVLGLLVKGKTKKEIAAVLDISVRTVDTHRYTIFRKLGIKTMLDLAKYALKKGYIDFLVL